MAYRQLSSSLLLVSLASLGACFNPPTNSLDSATDSATGTGTADGPSSMTSMTMTTAGTGSASADGMDTTPTTGNDATSASDTPPECTVDADCASMAGECEQASCDGGMCMVTNLDAGEPCGDVTETACDLADTCDGNGSCSSNVIPDGMDCSDCSTGQCTCTGGSCDDCIAFADSNLFSTDRSLNGWDLTGDWGLYTEAPFSQGPMGDYPAIPFGNQVLGTDGNRHKPYPGGHAERSYARTPPVQLPNSLQFQSWHLDEGSGSYDNKIIRISTDGGSTWTDIISCPLNPMLPFCTSVQTRAPDDWDSISLDLPAPLIGQVGIIEFAYDTFDDCCQFEKGWFIDVTNFATECLCTANSQCAPYGTDCGGGQCGSNGGCTLNGMPSGTACGDDTDNVCGAPDTCDGNGYCVANNNYSNNQILLCDTCEAGEDCNGCEDGVCSDCTDLADTNDFQYVPGLGSPIVPPDAGFTYDTVSGGAWQVFGSISNNENNDGTLFPMSGPFLGNNGNAAPPFDGVGEIANASVTLRPDSFTSALTFDSWNQDEGGATFDQKRIEVSVDDGATWTTVADCAGGGSLNSFAFCTPRMNRQADDWDSISIDTSTWDGMLGLVRITYDTVNANSGFERGWYIDNLNFAPKCLAPNLSSRNIQCENLPEDPCVDYSFCAWDAGMSTCLSCLNAGMGDQATCDANPLCEWAESSCATPPCQALCLGIQQ